MILGAGIAHTDVYELAAKIKDSIFELAGFQDVEIDYTGPTISILWVQVHWL